MILDLDSQIEKEVSGLNLPFPSSVGLLDIVDSISISSLPGGVTVQAFYNGVEDKVLPFEIAIKVKDKHYDAVQSLTTIVQHLEGLTSLKSENGSFSFNSIKVASAPFLADRDMQGHWKYITNINAEITVYNKKEVK